MDPPCPAWLGKALAALARRRPPMELLFRFSYNEMKLQYEQACETLGILDQSLYRLRHGGASHDRATLQRSLEAVKKRGRWAADGSVRRYEKGVRLQQIEHQLPAAFLKVCADLSRDLEAYVRSPMTLLPLPWQ